MTNATTETAQRLTISRQAPALYRAMCALDGAEDGLDPVVRNLVNVRVSQINGCAYCIDMHTKDARANDESEMRLFALPAWRGTPFFSPRERAALALAEAATRLPGGGVADDIYEEAAQHFASDELANLIWRITIINAWNRIGVTTRMTPGFYQPAVRHP